MKRFLGLAPKEEKKEPPKPTNEQIGVQLTTTIVGIKGSCDMLEKKEKLVEKQIAQLDASARKQIQSKDKRGAMMSLKKKKLYEQQLNDLGMQRLTLEQQIMSLEQSQTQHLAVQALQTGVNAAKAVAANTSADKVDQLIDDMQQLKDDQADLNQIFQGENMGLMEDEDLLNELQEMEAAQLEEKLLQAGPTPGYAVPAHGAAGTAVADPIIPSGMPSMEPQKVAVGATTTAEEDALAELTAGLGI